MTLKAPTKRNAEHLQIVSVEPLLSGFGSVILLLMEIYGNGWSSVDFDHTS
jgi:hypothetical protein